ncbi:hypothetical protein [Mucilaginibacter psychrotolerans]|uniref:Uncharacterized protein n=1 Tax=Mucilaginibacter psychrotolerans TaxID=1524096 RepID=A0A4Y8SFS2_9SPHI|nr:hypothetical protein [Mucilaginibacter psychrotolerans]TFF37889.1 hypothetical protein E2R66_09875 [Mucilaginibacter psychrotolerans]
MSTIEIFTLCNTILTTVTLTVTYFNYHHLRKKDFQDKLFQIKLDAYRDLNAKCYDAYLTLNINSEPFNEIYNIETKEEWDKYFEKEFMGLYKVGFGLQESIYGYAYLLPTAVIEKYYDFSNFCLGFVTMSAHFDTGLIVDNTDRMWGYYAELLNLIRHDLKIEVIDKGLLKRVTNPLL